MKKHFHGIQQRPGKPVWFGTSENGKYIFALPGNPVSSFVCLYAYIRFWLKKSLDVEDKPHYATWTRNVHFEPNLVYFIEARIQRHDDGKWYADSIIGNGSGDFINLIKTDGFFDFTTNY